MSRLLGPGVSADRLNDAVLGRTLDAIAEIRAHELFNEIVAESVLL